MTDLISRADAIEAVLKYFIPRSHTGERGEHEEDFVRTIFKELPSADAVSREALNDVKFVAIKGDKVEEAYRSGWNGAIECIIENAPSADAVQGDECDHCVYKWGMKGGDDE